MVDEVIIAKVQNGKTEDYGKIVKKYEKKLTGYIRNFTNQQPETVEDLVAETLIKGYENIQGFDVSRNFSSWIFRIAHNICLDYFKKKKAIIFDGNTDDFWENVEDKTKLIEEMEIEAERQKMMGVMIEKLELNYREVILLYYFENKSYEEMAEILHISISNVGVLLMRAREKLKKNLEFKI